MMFPPIPIETPAGVRSYSSDPIVQDFTERGDSRAERHETIKYQFERGGKFQLPDLAVIWWDPAPTGPDEIRKDGTGMWAFVDGGKRYLPGEWPTDSKLFDPEGAVTIYAEPPPGETPPQYPSPNG